MALGFSFSLDSLRGFFRMPATKAIATGRDRAIDHKLSVVDLPLANIFPALFHVIHGSITQCDGYAAPWHSESDKVSEDSILSHRPYTITPAS